MAVDRGGVGRVQPHFSPLAQLLAALVAARVDMEAHPERSKYLSSPRFDWLLGRLPPGVRVAPVWRVPRSESPRQRRRERGSA